MKKILKLKLILIFSLLFSIFVFSSNIRADSNFELTNIEVYEKSDGISTDKSSFEDLNIDISSTLYNLNDYITYKITLKNKTSKDYIISEITDNNTSKYVITDYAYDEKIDANSNFNIFMTFKLDKLIDDISLIDENDYYNLNNIKLSMNVGESKTTDIIINNNPQTGDNIKLYFYVAIISLIFIAVILLSKKVLKNKKIKIFVLLFAICVMIPVFANVIININISVNDVKVKVDTYTISYSNGKTKKYISDVEQTLELEIPAKEGYKFVGWSTTKNGQVEYENEDKIKLNKNLNFYPVYDLVEYTINYNLNGGKATNPSTYTIEDEIVLNAPTKENYEFVGWTGSNGETPELRVTINAGTTENKTYTANYVLAITTYKVIHKQISVDGTNSEIIDEEELTGKIGSKVTPETKTYVGYNTPLKQTVTIEEGGVTTVVYEYSRKVYNVSIMKETGIATVTGEGTYKYGENVKVSSIALDGYMTNGFEGMDINNNEFIMPANDVTLIAKAYLQGNQDYQVRLINSDITSKSIVANYVITPDDVKDKTSTEVRNLIQNAIKNCNENGGGTVFLASGIYHINKPIIIYESCTLMGEWQDPDKVAGSDFDYGTVIYVDSDFTPDKTVDNYDSTGVLKMQGDSGINGITMYYENQSVENPVEYPWSIYYTASTLSTVKNVTLINSYRGIGRPIDYYIDENGVKQPNKHSSLSVENVRATTLYKGVEIQNSAEVGTVTNLTLSPKYWANANIENLGCNESKPTIDAICAKTKALNGKGLILGSVEQSKYLNININGYKYGVYVPQYEQYMHAMGSGSFYNLNIDNCNYGFYVEQGSYTKTEAYERSYKKGDSTIIISITDYTTMHPFAGYSISNSSIKADTKAIYNGSDIVTAKKTIRGEELDQYSKITSSAIIKLNNVDIEGEVESACDINSKNVNGNNIIYSNNANDNQYTIIENGTNEIQKGSGLLQIDLYKYDPVVSYNNIVEVDSTCSVSTINDKISEVSLNGGGIVYFKPGKYTIDETIQVKENVELKGPFDISPCTGNYGAVFKVISNEINPISIVGNNAGISGIHFLYEENIRNITDMTTNLTNYINEDTKYTITASNVTGAYVHNVTLSAAIYGIHFNNVKDFSIKNIETGIMKNAIKIQGTDVNDGGIILNCLQNNTFISRPNNILSIGAVVEDNFNWNVVSKNNLEYIILNNTKNVQVVNCFDFRSLATLKVLNSQNINVVNIGANNILIDSTSNATTNIINALLYEGLDRNDNGNYYNIIRRYQNNSNDSKLAD